MILDLERNPETLGTPDRERVADIERHKLMTTLQTLAKQAGFTLTVVRPDATHRADGAPIGGT